jgi:hypothetical protein
MRSSKNVASDLFNVFLANGMFNLSCIPTDASDSLTPASTSMAVGWIREDEDFANIACQAIGYDAGATEEKTVYVYSSKGTERGLGKIEKEIDGVIIKVKKLNPLLIKPEQSQKTTNHPYVFLSANNRRACGSSCSPSNVLFAGTIGALIKREDDLFLLSNNHVIGGCNHAPVNTIIMTPAPRDSIGGIAPLEIGRLSALCPLRSGDISFVEPCTTDAAIAKITNPALVTSWQGDDINGYDTPTLYALPKAGMKVKKIGRTTGLTHGTIESLTVGTVKLPYKVEGFNATVYFKDFWFIKGDDNTAFAMPGDSGSLVVSEDGNIALGLIFAANGQYACITPLKSIFDALGGGELVGGYGISDDTDEGAITSETPQ